MTAPAPILARDSAVSAIRGRLEYLASGRPQVVFIEGEPGIGKTRLLDEALNNIDAVTLVRSRGDELQRRRPFGMLADALACRVSSRDPSRAEIARLISDGASEQVLLDGFTQLIERLSLVRPVLLALDDVQWADASTLLAIRYLTRHLSDVPIGAIIVFRPLPAIPELDALVTGETADGALRLVLGPLGPDAIAELVKSDLGEVPSPQLLALVARAGGNPFYVLELLASLRDLGTLDQSDLAELNSQPLPSVFNLSIRRYLRFLSPASLGLLRMATVLGTTFSVADLVAAVHSDVMSVLPVLDEARQAGILLEAGDRLAFRHDLLREALYDDMPLSARQALHRELSATLAARGAPPVVVAEHILASGGYLDNQTLSRLMTAAEQVANFGARAALLLRVLDQLPIEHAERPTVLAQTIWTLTLAGRGAEADELATTALAENAPLIEAPIRLAWLRSFSERNSHGRAHEQLELLRSRLESNPDLEAELLAREAIWRFLGLDMVGAEEAALQAVELARRTDNSVALVIALQACSQIDMVRGRGRDAVEVAQKAVREQRPNEPHTAHVALAIALLGEDRLEELDAACAAGERRCRETGMLNALPSYFGSRSVRMLVSGRFDDAITNSEVVLDLLDETQGNLAALALSIVASVALHRGDVEAARSAIDAGSAKITGPGYGIDRFLWASAMTLEGEGRANDAYQLLSSAWDSFSPFRLYPSLRSAALDLIRMALAAGDRDRVEQVADVLAIGAAGSAAPSTHGTAQLARAILRADTVQIGQAIDSFAKGPRVLATAQARELAADYLMNDDAATELRLAAATYRSVGATGDLNRVARALRRRGTRLGTSGRRQRPSTGWDSLTPSERNVVRLAAKGLTSCTVAERLYISVNTVETHLRHVYGKLGIRSRAELGAIATQNDRPQQTRTR
jgi:DNA-binding CsgD family transcriptional regulator